MNDIHKGKNEVHLGLAGALAKAFIASKLTPLIIIASILLGVFAVRNLPREEEPQIHVPFFDIFVPFPGASAKEVEKRINELGERKLWEIPGVEYVYSTAFPNMGMFVVRFKVGSNPEDSLIKVYTKVASNQDIVPAGAMPPMIKPRSIDDVPILALTFHSKSGSDPVLLRRTAAKVQREISGIENVSETTLIGGNRRSFNIRFHPEKLAAVHISPLELAQKISLFNAKLPAGHLEGERNFIQVETESLVRSADDLRTLVVGIDQGRAVLLKDVADVKDEPEELDRAVSIRLNSVETDAVTLSVSKRPGANAAKVVSDVTAKIESLRGNAIPENIDLAVTRDYGKTAREKSNELLFHMALATLSVILLVGLALGWREGGIVALAVPVTLALTLLVFYLYGYTLNRITLFALIFSIGILVDDAIVVVENIVRHIHIPENADRNVLTVSVEAVAEVGNPTVLATLTVIAAILPMAFVSGLMGPYMRPIPVGASAAMIFSLLVAFIVTPWAAVKLLSFHPGKAQAHSGKTQEGFVTRLYRKSMTPLIRNPKARAAFFLGVIGLLLAAVSLFPFKAVIVKMLPFDNKSEFQVVINLPEDSSLDVTRKAAREVADLLQTVPEVKDIETYVGASSPYNFNGLVRHYFLREKPFQADLQVNLVDKHERKRSSHEIAKTLHEPVRQIIAKYHGRVQVAEVPPGPPVLSTLVLEVYGPTLQGRMTVAKQLKDLLEKTQGVTDVDYYYEEDRENENLKVDRLKASLNNIPAAPVAQTVRMAMDGQVLGLAHMQDEPEPVNISLRLPKDQRTSLDSVRGIRLMSPNGNQIPVSALTTVEKVSADQPIYHKNLNPVTYVIADVGGRQESPVYALLSLRKEIAKLKGPDGSDLEQFFKKTELDHQRYCVVWDGEWQITYEVFRDLGLAFAAVLILIYILVVAWFQSFTVPLVIMAPIPLTLVGILPAHALMGAFFTATSMIGFIAGAGIIVRNSIILVDFIELRLNQGMALEEAVIDAGAVRFRPMLLTAAAVIVGASVILFDPIFQGLAVSLMAGEVASTLLSRMAVPILYYLHKK